MFSEDKIKLLQEVKCSIEMAIRDDDKDERYHAGVLTAISVIDQHITEHSKTPNDLKREMSSSSNTWSYYNDPMS